MPTLPPPKIRYDKRFNSETALDDYARYQSKIKKIPNGCWEYQGLRNAFGYGLINLDHKNWYTHRLAWLWNYGEIPDKMNVCHKCDNTSCVRPDHLFLGSHKENTRDMMLKQRSKFFQGVEWKGEHNQKAILKEKEVLDIVELYATEKYSMHELAKKYGTKRSAIGSILCGRSWQHVKRRIFSKNERKKINSSLKQPKIGENASNCKVTEEIVLSIRKEYSTGKWTQKMLAAKYGIGKSQVSNIVTRASWSHI